MHLALAILAGLLAGMTGTRYAAALKREASRLKRWEVLLARLSLLMQECAFSLPEAFREAADGPSEPDELLHTLAARLEADRLTSLGELATSIGDTLPEATILRRMLAGLGAGSLDMRLQALSAARTELQLLSAASAETAAKDAKMWAQLGWIGGACLVVLLV